VNLRKDHYRFWLSGLWRAPRPRRRKENTTFAEGPPPGAQS